MQAVILAAGTGSRLGSLTSQNPKCLVTIHEEHLINRSLDILTGAGVKRIVIVVGHGADILRKHVGDQWADVPIVYVENPAYRETNNIYSLYLAADELAKDDTLLLESDLIFDPEIITSLLADPSPSAAVVAKHQAWMDGTVVQVSDDGDILRFIPKQQFRTEEVDSYFKTVNIYKFSQDFLASTYLPFLSAYCEAMGQNEYYEQVLRIIMHLEDHGLKAHVLSTAKWYEIDDVQDLVNAATLFSPADVRYDEYLNRHGGYWRFPAILDYCYLVNPYFPTQTLVEEMQRSFDTLLREYPSALWVQNMMAGRLFRLDPAHLLVGNGAAELIAGLGSFFAGMRLGHFVPSFEEYAERFTNSDLERIAYLDDPGARSVEGVITLGLRNDGVILVNPDNPTGAYLEQAAVVEIAEQLDAAGKYLIIDESFVDFSREGPSATLLSQSILEAYPHVIVIKSISKSYGVPGARLGVIASSNATVIETVRQSLPVWNVNSFGEFFLQIVGKYEDDYRDGCAMLARERARMVNELNSLGWLTCLESDANFVMCRAEGRTAAEVAEQLLVDGILARDLTGKPGVPGNNYLRLAIRNGADNDRLIAALRRA